MPKQQRAIETRARIVEAAGELFAKRGYRATRVADIADAAGCALGALQFHFPAKTMIANAVVDEQHRLVMEAGRWVIAQEYKSGIDDIIVVSGKLADLITSSSVVRAGLRLSTESVDDLGSSAAQPYKDWIDHCVALLEKARSLSEIPDGLNIQDFAEVIISAFTGTQFLSAAVSGGADLRGRLVKLWPFLLAPLHSHHDFDYVHQLLES